MGLVANAGGAAVGSRQPAVPPEDLPNRLFIGGLPYFLNETMVKELVEAFGPTKSFMLVTDRETGNSKGYGFFVYQDQSVTDVAMQGLHGMQMGEKTLTVRRATGERRAGFGAGAGAAAANVPPPPPGVVAQPLDPASLQAQAMAHLAGGGAAAAATGAPPPPSSNPPSAVVSLGGMLDAEELRDDGDWADIEEDMREELGKFGALVEMVIPRPGRRVFPCRGSGGCSRGSRTRRGRRRREPRPTRASSGGEPSPPISSTSTRSNAEPSEGDVGRDRDCSMTRLWRWWRWWSPRPRACRTRKMSRSKDVSLVDARSDVCVKNLFASPRFAFRPRFARPSPWRVS